MAKVAIEAFDENKHPNPMSYIDNEQFVRYQHSGGLIPYNVCIVEVCGFQFIFHSTMQLELCLNYYERQIHPQVAACLFIYKTLAAIIGKHSAGLKSCRSNSLKNPSVPKWSQHWNAH